MIELEETHQRALSTGKGDEKLGTRGRQPAGVGAALSGLPMPSVSSRQVRASRDFDLLPFSHLLCFQRSFQLCPARGDEVALGVTVATSSATWFKVLTKMSTMENV